MEVAVAVVSWNTRDLLRDCLRSLEPEVRSGRVGVWVLDNASGDGSADMVAAEFAWVELIAGRRNLGFGAGVNAIAAAVDAAGDPRPHSGPGARRSPTWIVPANADIRLTPGSLDALLQAAAADPEAAILAPRLRLPDGRIQHSVHPFPGLATTLAVDLNLAAVLPALGHRLTLDGRWDSSRSRRIDWAHGACLLIRRDVFSAVGGFDPDQFLYAEDLDLAWRVRQAGWHTRYVPEATVEHAHSAAIDQLYGPARDLRAQAAAYAWLRRRRGRPVTLALASLACLGATARALIEVPDAVSRDPLRRERAWRARRLVRVHLQGLRWRDARRPPIVARATRSRRPVGPQR